MIGPIRRAVRRVVTIAAPPAPTPAPTPAPAPPPELVPLPELQVTHARWVACKGDQTLRQEYPLRRGDVVVDLGGYEGQWASDIYARYRTKVYVFEPVPHFAEQIRLRFQANDDVEVVEAAVGAADGRMQIGVAADASSSFGERESTVEVPVLDFVRWSQQAGVAEIGLLKINIEGGEYELLEHLIATGAIRRIRDIQVQFHNFVPDADARMAAIQERLSATHGRTYAFRFIWENWRRLPHDASGSGA